jgi:hypothetical protein
MTHRCIWKIGKKNVRVANDALSKLLLYLQELRANIAKQKAKWDSLQDYNESAT